MGFKDYLYIKTEGKTKTNICTTYNCWLMSFEVEPAQARTVTDTIIGMNGELDSTEWSGHPIYGNRKITFKLLFLPDDWSEECYLNMKESIATLRNLYNGQVVDVSTSSGNYHVYYSGRLNFETEENVKGSLQLTATVDAEPYRHYSFSTVLASSYTTPFISFSSAASLRYSVTAGGWKISSVDSSGKVLNTVTASEGDSGTFTIPANTNGTIRCEVVEAVQGQYLRISLSGDSL